MNDADAAIARSLLAGDSASSAALEPVTSGLSGASVFRVLEANRPPRYAKIARDPASMALRDEIARIDWLSARGVVVPKALSTSAGRDWFAVLTDAVPGVPADVSSLPLPQLIGALTKSLRALHALPVEDCPFDETLAVRLARAAQVVADDEVEQAQFEPRNRGIAPEMLLARLLAAQPIEDLVVVHGDATLSNILVDDNGAVGFVDCGNVGRGDRYLDLAVLGAEIGEYFGAEAAVLFARNYGGDWNAAKALYFSDLYELF